MIRFFGRERKVTFHDPIKVKLSHNITCYRYKVLANRIKELKPWLGNRTKFEHVNDKCININHVLIVNQSILKKQNYPILIFVSYIKNIHCSKIICQMTSRLKSLSGK